MCEVMWIHQLLDYVGLKISIHTKLWCDNQAPPHITSHQCFMRRLTILKLTITLFVKRFNKSSPQQLSKKHFTSMSLESFSCDMTISDGVQLLMHHLVIKFKFYKNFYTNLVLDKASWCAKLKPQLCVESSITRIQKLRACAPTQFLKHRQPKCRL